MAVENKQAAIDGVAQTIEALMKLRDELNELRDGEAGFEERSQLTRRIRDVDSTLFDQRSLLAHLTAATVTVQPLSEAAKQDLARALESLDQFVKADQALHERLATADAVVRFVGNHEQDIRGLLA